MSGLEILDGGTYLSWIATKGVDRHVVRKKHVYRERGSAGTKSIVADGDTVGGAHQGGKCKAGTGGSGAPAISGSSHAAGG